MNWLSDFFNDGIDKKAEQVDSDIVFERKLKANDWIDPLMSGPEMNEDPKHAHMCMLCKEMKECTDLECMDPHCDMECDVHEQDDYRKILKQEMPEETEMAAAKELTMIPTEASKKEAAEITRIEVADTDDLIPFWVEITVNETDNIDQLIKVLNTAMPHAEIDDVGDGTLTFMVEAHNEEEVRDLIQPFLANKKSSLKVKKKAAYAVGDTAEDTIKKDYELRVSGMSNYNLAEMLAEQITGKDGLTTVDFNEEKTKQLKYVTNNREAAEKKVLELIGTHTSVDWKKKFEEFKTEDVPMVKEKDLYTPEFKDGKQNWEKKDKWDEERTDKQRTKDMKGVGAEEEKNAIGNDALLSDQRKRAALEKVADRLPKKLKVSHSFDGWVIAGMTSDSMGWGLGFNFDSKEAALELANLIGSKYNLPVYVEEDEQNSEASQIEKITKVAFRTGDKLFYRGYPAIIKEIHINPFSEEAHVDVEVDANGKKHTLSLSGKEIKQLGDQALSPKQEEPKDDFPKVTPKIHRPEGTKPEEKKEPVLEVVKEEPKKQEQPKSDDKCSDCGKSLDVKDMRTNSAGDVVCEDCKKKVLLKDEIPMAASKKATLTIEAEIESPWRVVVDKDGKEKIARVTPSKNTKKSKEVNDSQVK